jgi:chorismate synthase
MSGNLFGEIFRVMTFGESHGPYIGVIIDGVQPGVPIDLMGIQDELKRRRPGQSKLVSPRKEEDRAEIVSGIFEGKTTGTPICILIGNKDQRAGDYKKLQHVLRPGHASSTFLQKYGIFDYRGGGRASGRETASRVAAGAIAKQLLQQRGIKIFAYTYQISNIEIETIDLMEIEKNPVRAPDPKAARKMIKAIENAQKKGDSLGGIIEIRVLNCPAGLGEPVFNKLEADLAQALMSIGAVKAFEMGDGFKASTMKGSQFNDQFYFDRKAKRFRTKTNHAGGVLGGITNGEELVMRIAVKPPSSISKKQQSVDYAGKTIGFKIGGRHDPCICPRIVPVAEAMVALVVIDHLLMQERITEQKGIPHLESMIRTIDTQLILLLKQRLNLIENIKERSDKPIDTKIGKLSKDWYKKTKTINLPPKLSKVLFEILTKYS